LLGPLIVELSKKIDINPMIIIGIYGLTGCVATLFLKETFNEPLTTEIPELSESIEL